MKPDDFCKVTTMIKKMVMLELIYFHLITYEDMMSSVYLFLSFIVKMSVGIIFDLHPGLVEKMKL